MAKRFTGTEKWDKAWFRKLKPKYKCFWEYLRDKCDLVGLWEIDFDSASFHIGEEIIKEDVLDIFKNKILIVGDKILIVGFCKFQYGETLSLKSPIHKKVFDILNKYTLYDTLYNRVENSEEDKVEEKVKDKVEEKVKDKVEEIIFPFESENFIVQWNLWKLYKQKEFNFNYKSKVSEQAALKKLSELSEGIEQDAILIIHQSLSEGWKGFFKLIKQNDGKQANNTTGADQEFRDKTAKRLGLIKS